MKEVVYFALLVLSWSVARKIARGNRRYFCFLLREISLRKTTLFMPLEIVIELTNFITLRLTMLGYRFSFVLQWYNVVQETLDAKKDKKGIENKKKVNHDDDE